MAKVLNASCVGGVVSAEGVSVPNAVILSEGVGASAGVLILDGPRAYYAARTTPDLETTLENLILALDQVKSALDSAASALTTIDNKPAGTLPPSPAAGADIAGITSAGEEIAAASGDLDALRDYLR